MATSHSLLLYGPTEASEEAKAAAGFLAGFSGVGVRADAKKGPCRASCTALRLLELQTLPPSAAEQ